jgi:hypothetical protein
MRPKRGFGGRVVFDATVDTGDGANWSSLKWLNQATTGSAQQFLV